MDKRIAVLRSRLNFLGFVDATISKTPKVEEKPFFLLQQFEKYVESTEASNIFLFLDDSRDQL